MEEKKSYKADLENKRTTGFLLGFILAMSVFIVALEYTSYSREANVPEDLTESITEELQIMSGNERKDLVTAKIPDAEKRNTEKINIVEQVTDKEIANPEDTDNGQTDNIAYEGDNTKKDLTESITPAIPAENNDDVLNFRVVEQLPEYPGGMSAFMKWLTNNLRYPYIAQKNNRQGKVIVAFIINKDGSISDIRLVKGVDASLDHEALRVVNMMPKWKPGKDNGKPCRTYFCIPVVFKL